MAMVLTDLHQWYLKRVQELMGQDFVLDLSIPPQALIVLERLLDEYQPGNIGEFGGGFSTFLFTRWARDHQVQLTTLDHNQEWLVMLATLLREQKLPSEHLSLLDSFRSAPDHFHFDFIFLDHGPSWDARYADIPLVSSVLSPDGLLVLDDWFPPGGRKPRGYRYSIRATSLLKELGFQVNVLESSRPNPQDKALAVAKRI
jgi:predicted O-methyltransferase YrrM